jgi:hypothetical protein
VTVTEPFFRLLPPATGSAVDPPGTQRVFATGSTAGPWFPDGQHMGPPSALLVRALEACDPRPEMLLSRVTVEVLGRVPMGELTVSSRVERAGRTIELVSAEIAAEGRAVARAAGWRLAATDTAAAATAPGPAMPGPAAGREIPTPEGWLPGYLDALEWRWLAGHLGESGPGRTWGRLRVPVVEDEEPTPWQRLAAVADSTNGAASRLDLNAWLFVNTDLTLHVHRAPRGEWIGLDADSVIGPEGLGTAFSVLHDGDGPVGRAAQALTVRPR